MCLNDECCPRLRRRCDDDEVTEVTGGVVII